MVDGQRVKIGLEELIMGIDISSLSSSTGVFFFCNFIAFEYLASGRCWNQN
jgi:hypothetical protein